jgi:hypothetical protein
MGKDIPSIYSVLPNHINEREYEKFGLDDEGHVYVRTSVFGEIRPAGLNIAGKNTGLLVGVTAIKIPSTPLANRNAISLYNTHATATVYVGFDNTVTASLTTGTTTGWPLFAQNFYNVDIADTVELWVISDTADTLVIAQEFA